MNEFFKSESHKVVFALNYLDGEARMRVLGITLAHFTNSKVREQWHDKMKELILNSEYNNDETLSKLNDIYNEMI